MEVSVSAHFHGDWFDRLGVDHDDERYGLSNGQFMIGHRFMAAADELHESQ